MNPAPLYDPPDFGICSEEDFKHFITCQAALAFGLNKYASKLDHAQQRLSELCELHNHAENELDRSFFENWIPYHKDVVDTLVHRVEYLTGALSLLVQQKKKQKQQKKTKTTDSYPVEDQVLYGC